uniref:Uncharacterized protein n=1 Tax=Cyanoderma ruficeps TaxID=181631 RepID=A0A8C3P573_9PASS
WLTLSVPKHFLRILGQCCVMYKGMVQSVSGPSQLSLVVLLKTKPMLSQECFLEISMEALKGIASLSLILNREKHA